MEQRPQGRAGEPVGDRADRMLWAFEQLHVVGAQLGATTMTPSELAETALRALRRVVAYGRATVLLAGGGQLRVVATDPPGGDGTARPGRSGLAGRVLGTRVPIVSDDVTRDARTDERTAGDPTRSWAGVPLFAGGDVVGVLTAEHPRPARFDADDVAVLRGVAAQLGAALGTASRGDEVARVEMVKSAFLDRVSHELRTPVTVVSGFARTMLEHDDDLLPAQRRLFLERLLGASERLEAMVDQVLTVTSLEAGVQAPSVRLCDVGAVVEAEAKASGGPQVFRLALEPDLVVVTDGTLVALAVRSLLTNARAYAGGARVRGWRAADHGIVVDVVDDGPGVPDEVVPVMFERFARGDHTAAGLGLGLPLARHLLGLVGGSLEHVPREQGAVFRMRLPADATRPVG